MSVESKEPDQACIATMHVLAGQITQLWWDTGFSLPVMCPDLCTVLWSLTLNFCIPKRKEP